jgi:hypothetical protein
MPMALKNFLFTACVTLIINHLFPESIKGMREWIEFGEGPEKLIQAQTSPSDVKPINCPVS